jgi:hypothetical protein
VSSTTAAEDYADHATHDGATTAHSAARITITAYAFCTGAV